MNNETYSAKEIIFGLKNEYQKLREELNKLNQYIEIYKKNIKDIKFTIRKGYSNSEQIELYCRIIEQQNKIKRLINEFKQKTGLFFIDGLDVTMFSKSENNKDYIPCRDLGIRVKEDYQQMFSEQVDNILEQKLVQYFLYTSIFSIDKNAHFEFSPTSIHHGFHNKMHSVIEINYDDLGNYIQIGPYYDYIFNQLAQDLETRYLKSDFPEYFQRVIEEQNIANKQIEILDISDTHIVNKFGINKFEIIEEPKKLILQRINKPKED